jgi:phosphoribosylanthranilate isomerase
MKHGPFGEWALQDKCVGRRDKIEVGRYEQRKKVTRKEDEKNMLKVKICGITNLEDASLAVDLGTDALGFIFAPSPRQVSPEDVRHIIRELPPFVKTVGVFVNEDPETIRDTMQFCGLDMVQMHGDEPPELCNRFMPDVIKALRIKDRSDLESVLAYKAAVRALLLDTYSENSAGGTGRTFDWDLAIGVKGTGIPIILAGGLGPSNIQDAVSRVRPYAVDVNSAIEERPGKKSKILMEELFERIKKI